MTGALAWKLEHVDVPAKAGCVRISTLCGSFFDAPLLRRTSPRTEIGASVDGEDDAEFVHVHDSWLLPDPL